MNKHAQIQIMCYQYFASTAIHILELIMLRKMKKKTYTTNEMKVNEKKPPPDRPRKELDARLTPAIVGIYNKAKSKLWQLLAKIGHYFHIQ